MKSEIEDKPSPYMQAQASLIHAWRNEIKYSFNLLSEKTGIDVNRLKGFEAATIKPDWSELEKLAKYFYVSVRDLLPAENDLQRGIAIMRHRDSCQIDQKRQERLQYTYWSRAMSSQIPNFKPVELLLHLHTREEVVLNRGHMFHQYTQVLHSGPVAYLWKHSGKIYEETFNEGDSWLIPGYVPHGFYSPDKARKGRILAITFGQHLAGDAREELRLIGKENIGRIVEDESDYYKS